MSSLSLLVVCLFIIYHTSAIEWNGNWALACDFHENNLMNIQSRGEDCGGRCASTSGCTHFTWTTHNGGTCWMKQGAVSKENAVPTDDRSMVCGVIDNVPSQPGKTTRYWDCCKPSCAWDENVSGNNIYVKSCRQDGYSVFDHPHARSGCHDGGEGDYSFTCNNQKQWAINDQLAYGFAAATIPGVNEQDRCCSCYKLDFTSEPVRGKSMIVQVTNSGKDVADHQFDLQIPGGGVGIFNGCSSQWNAPNDGWGQRHGGVNSRDECSSLPEQIRDGCFFRFDWFKGADNPTMTYSKVDCPRELIDITGCSH
ncbi:hypothetical protein I4U23_011544 [Adineta vaga]|nr:hypothetical protein I4U23_011544 [Adineta vaga]